MKLYLDHDRYSSRNLFTAIRTGRCKTQEVSVRPVYLKLTPNKEMEKKIKQKIKEILLRYKIEPIIAKDIARDVIDIPEIFNLTNPTPSSLPTDEEIENSISNIFDDTLEGGMGHNAGSVHGKLEAIQKITNYIRTNFSSEKFIDWYTKENWKWYSPTQCFCKGNEFLSYEKLYQIFKQEQQTTK